MKLNKLLIIGFSSILLTSVVSAKDKEKAPKKTFEEVDTDKDGKVSEAEFVVGAKNEEKAKAHFKKKDKDADGFLSKEEFAKKGKGKKGPKKPKKKKKDE
jgi:Ca2+-binding EF-hand superfamily protein